MNAEPEGRRAAEQFRREHHLGVQPLGDLVPIIEQATGIDVAILDASPDEHGLAIRDPDRNAVFIGVARTQNPMRQRSTLTHELAHVLFEDWVTDGDNPSATITVEARCRSFARHLLVPVEGLREFLEDQGNLTLAALYTPQLAARFGWSDQYHALQADSNQRRAPQRLLARAISGYAEGVLSAQAIATLRGIPLDQVEAELREAGVVPVKRPAAWTAASEGASAHQRFGPAQRPRNRARRDSSQVASGSSLPRRPMCLAKVDTQVDSDTSR